MTRIFLRIYGGITVSLLLVAMFTFVAFEAINHYRLLNYRMQMVSGSMNLIAGSLVGQTDAARKQHVEDISESLGVLVNLKYLDNLVLNKTELKRVKNGELVFLSPRQRGAYAVALRIPDESDLLVSVEIANVTEQMGRATVELIAAFVDQGTLAEQEQRLEDIRPYFGFPISLVTPIQVFLDSEQWERIGRQESVLVLDESAKAIRLYTSLPSSRKLLFLGPIEQFDPYPYQLVIFIGFLALSFLGLAAYLLVHPLEWRLRRLEQMVKRIKKGDLDTRVEVIGKDAISQLSVAFNQMAEHVQILLDSQKEMTSAVSHELRTPVARLRFGLEMIEDAENDEERLRFMEGMDIDIEQLDELIDEILTYARLEQGTPVLHFKKLNVNNILTQICREMAETAGKAGIEIECETQATEPVLVEAEARYLHRVVQNLVGNAIRYAGSRVRMRFEVQQDVCKVMVEDDGPGVPENEWEHVFTPFARLDNSRNRASGGYGLGLSIVQRIAFWHGGQVTIGRSSLGGARFEMVWPKSQKRAPSGIGLVVPSLKQSA